MNYQEALTYIHNIGLGGSKLGLDNIRELLKRLGNPESCLKFIHVAGTNGKGSVIAFLNAVLEEAGYRVGRYTSPALYDYREQMMINSRPISKDMLAGFMTKAARAAHAMQQDGLEHPTAFEIETAVSYLYFVENHCDLVLLETGLGGRLDATNVVETSVMEIFTSISMDHMEILGNTQEEIVIEKAGIIKPGTYVITSKQKPEVQSILYQKASAKQAKFFLADTERVTGIKHSLEEQSFYYESSEPYHVYLAGKHQIMNAVTAIEAARRLNEIGYSVCETAIHLGLKKAIWPGRLSILGTKPLFVVDGAHNEEAAQVVREYILSELKGKKIILLVSIFRDKAYRRIMEQTAPLADLVIFMDLSIENMRMLPAKELAEAAKDLCKTREIVTGVAGGIKRALEEACNEDVILAMGSLSFIGEMTKIYKQHKVFGSSLL